MNRARAPQGDNDPSGKRGKPNTAQVAIILGIAAGTAVIALVGAFLWLPAWTAMGVVFVVAALIFIIPIVIFIARS